jgi:hypothetical protein
MDLDLVIELLGRYRVSLDMLAFRLHNIGTVNAQERDRIRKLMSSRIAVRPGRLNDLQAFNERRAPKPLLDRALKAFSAGRLGLRPLAVLLDVDLDRFVRSRPGSGRGTRPEWPTRCDRCARSGSV